MSRFGEIVKYIQAQTFKLNIAINHRMINTEVNWNIIATK